MPAIPSSCSALSSRDAKRRIFGELLRETFSAFSQKRLVARKSPAFSWELAEDCLKVERYFLRRGFKTAIFSKEDRSFSQVTVAYSVHVGEKIAE
jgi:hypothetical protein